MQPIRPIEIQSVAPREMWARVLREAGGRVRDHVCLRDALPTIDPRDERNREVVVTGTPLARGLPVAIDATLISP